MCYYPELLCMSFILRSHISHLYFINTKNFGKPWRIPTLFIVVFCVWQTHVINVFDKEHAYKPMKPCLSLNFFINFGCTWWTSIPRIRDNLAGGFIRHRCPLVVLSFQIIFVCKFLATGEDFAFELERSELHAGMLEKSEGDGFPPGNYYLDTPTLKGGTRVPKHVKNSVLGNLLVLAR